MYKYSKLSLVTVSETPPTHILRENAIAGAGLPLLSRVVRGIRADVLGPHVLRSVASAQREEDGRGERQKFCATYSVSPSNSNLRGEGFLGFRRQRRLRPKVLVPYVKRGPKGEPSAADEGQQQRRAVRPPTARPKTVVLLHRWGARSPPARSESRAWLGLISFSKIRSK